MCRGQVSKVPRAGAVEPRGLAKLRTMMMDSRSTDPIAHVRQELDYRRRSFTRLTTKGTGVHACIVTNGRL